MIVAMLSTLLNRRGVLSLAILSLLSTPAAAGVFEKLRGGVPEGECSCFESINAIADLRRLEIRQRAFRPAGHPTPDRPPPERC